SDAASPDAAPSSRPGLLRVATFNVHRFFDTVCDTGACGPDDYEAVSSPAQFAAQAAQLATGIMTIDPDVIALEEVEDQACLDALTAELASRGASYPIAHLGELGFAGSVDVAILARHGTLDAVKTHHDAPLTRPDGSHTTFARELLELRMTFGARPVVMFAAHFRSQVDDDPGRRLAEAGATRDIMSGVAAELPGALVVLGGDLNAAPGSDAVNALEEGGALVRVAGDLPVADQGTYLYAGSRTALDHVFVVRGQASRYRAMSAHVYREGTRGLAGSDHAALSADFTID
ncbi:MAG: endonuclease/exonuclease/phosphatase, partial [Labilithrix sp.]|nr:endonuclease/exonuclease/phosphatase [Labilithrix sp.]